MKQPSNIIQLAMEIESRSADIYTSLSRMFRNMHKVSDFWKELMKDENIHANIFKDVNDNLKKEIQKIKIDDNTLRHISATHTWIMTDLIDTVHNLNDAYELSHQLETKEVEMLFDLMSTDLKKYIEELELLIFEEQGHLQKILDFSGVYGNAEWRKGIIAQ